jgi:ribosome recycling factor
MSQALIKTCEQAMDKRLKNFEGELTKVRTGRASITILDRVRVDYYGTPTPLNQVATLSTPDARTIAVAPFEKKLISEIEKAIFKADLGVSPTNDGNLIRIPVPQLNEERRKELVKGIKKTAEDAKVLIRNERRDANESAKKQEKEKQISEDEGKKIQAEIQKITDKFIKLIDDRVAAKEKEVMTI